MNKKNLIILTISIIVLVVAIAAFFYFNTLNSKNTDNSVSSQTENTKSTNSSTFYFYDIDGNKLTLQDFPNNPTAILLWKSDEPTSFDMINIIQNYYEEYKDSINFVTINTKEPDLSIVENVKDAKFSIPMYFDTDSSVEKELNVGTLPSIIFMKEDGTITQKIISTLSEDAFTANLDLLLENY